MDNNYFDMKNVQNITNQLNELEIQNNKMKFSIDLMKKLITKTDGDIESKKLCPICGNISPFNSFGNPPRHNVLCPKCGSIERNRQAYLLFMNRYKYFFKKAEVKLLHFAPEKIFYEKLSKIDNVDYYPVDIDVAQYESQNIHIRNKVDITNIPYEENTFDIIYNSHVLEHIPNDIKAMQELKRVLKKDGICIIMVPLSKNFDQTYEDENINTPELRLLHYGQEDHVRIYGNDFKNRLESAGFHVEAINSSDIVNFPEEQNFCMLGHDEIFICTK